jgi:hypothetical protein
MVDVSDLQRRRKTHASQKHDSLQMIMCTWQSRGGRHAEVCALAAAETRGEAIERRRAHRGRWRRKRSRSCASADATVHCVAGGDRETGSVNFAA